MKDSKLRSFIEVMTNLILWLIFAVLIQHYTFPLFWIEMDLDTNLKLALIFKIVSVIKWYRVRRFFNFYNNRKNEYQ